MVSFQFRLVIIYAAHDLARNAGALQTIMRHYRELLAAQDDAVDYLFPQFGASLETRLGAAPPDAQLVSRLLDGPASDFGDGLIKAGDTFHRRGWPGFHGALLSAGVPAEL